MIAAGDEFVFVVKEFRAGGGVEITVCDAIGFKIAEIGRRNRIYHIVQIADLRRVKRPGPYGDLIHSAL